jgi:predicted PurR-regulated permease PerM
MGFGSFVIGLIYNFLRPLRIGSDTRMPGYVVLISKLGDVEIFGLNGFVIGPVIAGMSFAAWEIVTLVRADFGTDGDN